MSDPISETVRIADSQLSKISGDSSPSKADEGQTDTYVDGSSAGCSTSSVSAKSTVSFWALMFRLFGFD